MECNKDAATLTSFVERDRIFEFLSGLNSEYDPIRVQILGKEKLPSLSEVFYTVRGEESRRSVMLDEKQTDGSALIMSKSSKTYPSNVVNKNGSTCSLALNGKHLNSQSFHASSTFSVGSWVVDCGATDHMTFCPSNFLTYFPCTPDHTIAVADCSGTIVAGHGDIELRPSLSLKNVLHVPKLTTNLLSINKLTKDLNCAAIFFDTHCVFQELATGRTIGIAKEQ
ncbi:RNA-directed DNA polymerase [Handroanthus impetiginosus]|uniref:RNA-directed DNA polymerase n=1 Tax=Handroanthus impetiginosus TaxID=429701 RepID=A0A2G9G3F7_9LAMI|nr:RNA-directed DNA polymerase [Handroanthus impetiginosus]